MERSGFFDSEVTGHNTDGTPVYDREYLSEFFALYFSSFIGNGVFPNPATNLQLASNNDMTVIIKSGKAWINGIFYINTDNLIFKIDIADGVLNRIDRVVLRLDFLERKIKTVVKKGVYAGTAVAPTLQRDADAHEIALADIAINRGIISISQANITDLRLSKDLCGIVHGTVDQVDPTAIFNQYQAWFTAQSNNYDLDMVANEAQFKTDFETWFATIQGQLSGDIAGNLVASISNLAGTGRTTETVKGNAAAIVTLDARVTSHSADNSKQVPHLGITTNSGDAYSITTTETILVNQKFTITINANSSTTPTLKINTGAAYAIKKANGNSAKLYASPYTFFWNGTNFIQLGEGGDYGTATKDNVLQGSTIGTESGIIQGTMPDLSLATVAGTAWTKKNWVQRPGADVVDVEFVANQTGKITPLTKYEIGIVNLVPKNVVSGVAIGVGANSLMGTAPNALKCETGEVLWVGFPPQALAASGTDTYWRRNGTTTFLKVCEVVINTTGIIRFKFDLSYDYPPAGYAAVAQIFVNDIARGILRTTNSEPYITYTEDITINAGDRISLYLKVTGGGGYVALAKNIGIYQSCSQKFATVTL